MCGCVCVFVCFCVRVCLCACVCVCYSEGIKVQSMIQIHGIAKTCQYKHENNIYISVLSLQQILTDQFIVIHMPVESQYVSDNPSGDEVFVYAFACVCFIAQASVHCSELMPQQ